MKKKQAVVVAIAAVANGWLVTKDRETLVFTDMGKLLEWLKGVL